MHLEVRVLVDMLIEYELRMAQFARQNQWLHSLVTSSQTSLDIALMVVAILLHITDLNCVSDTCCCLFIANFALLPLLLHL